ncbi:serine/threonine-protein kinase ULK1a isoform X1 [Oryzias melastigma]|nr:serine/threonine-protein kinase ULK1a isoform X1 [Oryzias melastigma]
MESVGKFEFSRKDLIGHGAFAVVFKGRHKEKHGWEVAVKCINRKNLAKSQSLLGKEIKILKELKHENIVRLLDYQEIGGCIYLVMEYCNGGDLAEYLHSKGTLSEDTIRVFLQQIAQAMKVLQSKGILHRDLKPQNILLCHPEGRKSSSISASIKIADFGFARHLQTNMMAATLCGSPMYMAPEVIMSQNYDAKADLWSIGTIVYQCLTGKAPFHASSPQELRLFYESNTSLLPSVPKETSPNLRHLLLGLLQRNHKERITFDEFFHHPFLETSTSTKKCLLVAPISFPTSGSGSSSSSSSTSQLASPQCSDGETHQPKEMHSPTRDTTGFLQKEKANPDISNAPSYAEDYVMVPAQFPSEYTSEMESTNESCLMCSGGSRPIVRVTGTTRRTSNPSLLHSPPKACGNPVQLDGPARSKSVPIPVPTQIQNYQRMRQNLEPAGVHGSTRAMPCCTLGSRGMRRASAPAIASLSTANFSNIIPGGQPQQFSPLVGQIPKTSEQNFPLSSRTELLSVFPDPQVTIPKNLSQPKKPNRTKTVSDLECLYKFPAFQTNIDHKATHKKGAFKRSLSTGRLSDMLLKAAFGANLLEEESDESFGTDRSMDIPAPPAGSYKCFQFSDSPPPVVFAMGSPSQGTTPPDAKVSRMFSGSPSHISSAWPLISRTPPRGARRNSETDAMDVILHRNSFFHLPGLPEDTLMEEAHVDALSDLRFTLAFVHCIMELASSKDPELEACSPDISFLQKSLVTDQISLLSREWSFAEQLVLYMKAEEFLSSALHTAKENIKQGQLQPSSIVKQVIRKLNDLYKSCVSFCRSLNDRLQTFLLDKQKLMDRFGGLTAEKLIYSHTVHMVQSAALDEMFHYGTSSVQRYNKALLLMEGLSRILTEQQDIESIDKCKECIEKRLSALQT